MSRQQFVTADVLRLEVQGDPAPGTLTNLIPNPSGRFGAWGWLSPLANTAVRNLFTGLNIYTSVAQATYVETELLPLPTGATQVRGAFTRGAASNLIGLRGRAVFYDADGVQIGQTAQTALITADNASTQLAATGITGGAKFAKWRLDMYRSGGNPAANDSVSVTNVVLVAGTAAQVGVAILQLDDGWVDVLGPTHEIVVERAELDLGTLTATILDADLDPSQSGTIRKGKRVQLVAEIFGQTEELFTGEVLKATVAYDLTAAPAKRARIQLTAVDQAQVLGNVKRPDGVAAIDELPFIFEGCGVAWNVNGSSGHALAAPVIVSRNENASAIDQVAITRDTALGYAWFDRFGVVQVWDSGDLDASGGIPLTEADYNPDVSVDYDTERCINYVTVKYLRLDPSTGETEEVAYGPYTDEKSRRDFGTQAAEFTVHGITEDAATFETYAAAVLAANATPAVRINEATVPVLTEDDMDDWAVRDLYDLMEVSSATLGIAHDSRITKLTHRITPDKWLVTFGFTVEGGVAQPQVTPSPGPSGGKTLSELLRPVGEVTQWYGTLAQVPEGWLAMVGGTFDPATYPKLYAHLGANTLPDMTDVMPIGAGTKALGTSGGSATKTLAAANVPAHSHPLTSRSTATAFGAASAVARPSATGVLDPAGSINTGQNASGTGGNPNPFDVMNPWRALYFLIRAA